MKKKYFIITICFFVINGCSKNQKVKNDHKKHPLAIVQGTTNSTETFISVLSHKANGELKFFVTSIEEPSKPVAVYSYLKKISPNKKRVIEKLNIKNLKDSKSYKLTVKSKDRVLDERSFKTLSLKKKSVRIGVASCMDDRISSAEEMWKSYLNKFLDVNFFIGDNVYADRSHDGLKKSADKEQLWTRYAQTWDKLYFYHSSHLSPTYYLWDDHDYGKNNGGAEYKNKAVSAEIFWMFHPNDEIKGVYKKTLGAGSVLNAFGQKFIFVDGRYFRDKRKDMQWGKEQKKIVLNELKESRASVNWLIQGDQFFGGYHPFESFERDNPKDFKKTLQSLKKTGKKIAFLSGDRHLTEIMRIEKKVLGYETVEITSSGIHAKVFPGSFKKNPNPRMKVGKAGVYNYTALEFFENKTKNNEFKVISYGAKDWTHYTKKVSL